MKLMRAILSSAREEPEFNPGQVPPPQFVPFPNPSPENPAAEAAPVAPVVPPPLTKKKIEAQVELTPAQHELIVNMLPLVKTVVGRIAISLPPHIHQEDLLSAGLIGLMDAVRRYDATKGSSLKSYVAMRVRGAVLDELRSMDWAPRSVHRQARDFRKVQQALEQRLGREASEEELASELHLNLDELEKLLASIRPASFISLQDVRSFQGLDGDLLQEECIADVKATTPLDATLSEERRRLVVETIQSLTPVEQKVLALYYYEDLRLKEIAETLHVTESRVSQIHTLAIQRLRSRLERIQN